MKSWVTLSVAALTLLAFAGRGNAGANAGATVKLAWGFAAASQSINASLHDISIQDTVNDTTANLWVTTTGVTNIRGLDLQIAVLSDRGFGAQFALPDAWQFTDPSPCGDPSSGGLLASNFSITTAGLGTGNVSLTAGIPGLATSQKTMALGTGGDYDGIWYIWFSAAGTGGAARTAGTRYTIARIDFTVPGGSGSGTPCTGNTGAVCFQPSLRLGYNSTSYPAYTPFSVALLDGTGAVDFAALDPNFKNVTANYLSPANPTLNGCPAPTGIRATTWGQLRRTYR